MIDQFIYLHSFLIVVQLCFCAYICIPKITVTHSFNRCELSTSAAHPLGLEAELSFSVLQALMTKKFMIKIDLYVFKKETKQTDFKWPIFEVALSEKVFFFLCVLLEMTK